MAVTNPAITLPNLPPELPELSQAERLARLRLARSRNVGPRTYAHLLRRFRTAHDALEALPELAARGGDREYGLCPEDVVEAEWRRGMELGACLSLVGEPGYPRLLATIQTPPPAVWVLGQDAVLERPAVAIVGARNASALGLRTARSLARELGEAGRIIVSGLARGIDAVAHEASLETGTCAVLAGGIDRPYPPENLALAERIAADGALISECPIGTEPTARHFPKRNRLIAGLSEAVVLVEAASRSGSLITARYALEQGREVMAVPGSPEDPRAAGCNGLIRDGAALVRHAQDVLDALALPARAGFAEDAPGFRFDAAEFDAEEDGFDALADFDPEGHEEDAALAEQVVRLLGPQPVEIDEVARACGARASDLSLVLLELELAGRVALLPGAKVCRMVEEG
ncbi:MAG: DNA-processing protein DprA [Pikeienuella sp.]